MRTQGQIEDYFSSLYAIGFLTHPPLPPLKSFHDNYLKSYVFFLDDFLHKLIQKEYIINCELTLNFFELENHLDHYQINLPIKKNEFNVTSDKFNEISDFYYSADENLLFIAKSGEEHSFLSNWLFSTVDPLGEISIYNILQKGEIFDSQKIKSLYFASKISRIKFLEMSNKEFNFLFICFNNGSINIYQVYNNVNGCISNELIELLGTMNLHSHRIVDLGIDKNSGYIYSVGENENMLIISEFNYQKIILKIRTDFYIKSLFFDSENKKLIFSDVTGSFFIYQVQGLTKLVLLQAMYTENKSFYKSPLDKIFLDNDRNFIFTSSGYNVQFYDFNEKENFQFELKKRLSFSSLQKDSRINNIKYKYAKGELILSTNNGFIEFWSHDFDYPVMSFKPFVKEILKMSFDKKQNLLFVAGDNGKICIYLLPDKWVSEVIRRNQSKNEVSLIENSTQNKDNISLLKDAFLKMSFGSTEIGDETKKVDDDSIMKLSIGSFNSEKENMKWDNNRLSIKENEVDDNVDSSLDGWEEYDLD